MNTEGSSEEQKDFKSKIVENIVNENRNKVPVYRGCPNTQCFCTGKCREIVGYRDRLPEEESPYDFRIPFNQPQEDPSREAYEAELKRRQEEHLERVRRNTEPYGNWNQGYKAPWRPCMHDQCSSCHGTGVKFDGSICIHMISCPCPKCSPSCITTSL